MKTVKLSKKDLNGDLYALYKKYELIKGNNAYPNQFFVSHADYKTIEKNLAKMMKKDHPGISKRSIEYAVSMEMLNLGPSTVLGNALKPGYAVVDV